MPNLSYAILELNSTGLSNYSTLRKEMSSVSNQRRRWCEQDHAIVSVEFHNVGPTEEKARRP